MAFTNVIKIGYRGVIKEPCVLRQITRSMSVLTKTDSNDIDLKKGKRINKGIMANIEKIQARAEYMKEQEYEFEIGKRHLANMMGKDPQFFTQEDIDRSIEYLLPSALFDVKARPLMKPPEQIFAKEKEAQFDVYGRPYHPFFYTVLPQYYEKLHIISCKVRKLDHVKTAAALNKSKPVELSSIQTIGTRWVNLDEFMEMHDEKYKEPHLAFFIQSLEALMNHPYGSREKDFILQYRRSISGSIDMEIPPLMYDDTGRPYMEHTTRCMQSFSTVKVYGRGTGKLFINGTDINFFDSLQDREEITFPLVFTYLADSVDVFVNVTGIGSATMAHATRHAISMCLASMVDEQMRLRMKIAGLLQVDIRKRERKKPGQEGKRRKFTWKKR